MGHVHQLLGKRTRRKTVKRASGGGNGQSVEGHVGKGHGGGGVPSQGYEAATRAGHAGVNGGELAGGPALEGGVVGGSAFPERYGGRPVRVSRVPPHVVCGLGGAGCT